MLETERRAEVEAKVREACDAGQLCDAATLAIESYGPEILGYLVAVTRNEADAGEAFAMFSEDLWRGLEKFRWEASLRTWAYTVARNAMHRMLRDPHRRVERRIPLSQSPEAQNVALRVRTQTLPYLRTEVKDRVAELRRELDPEDQTLFILRLNRKMSWNEIASIMGAEGELDDTERKRQAARLRKRFERAKEILRDKAREHGLT